MTLTPQDILSQQFHVRIRGFDQEEVDAFLDTVAEDMQQLLEENAQIKDELVELKNSLKEYRSQEKSFQQAIISAQKITEEMETRSRQEAESLVSKARAETERLFEETRTRTKELEDRSLNEQERLTKEIKLLKGKKSEIKEELRGILISYLHQVNNVFGNQAQAETSSAPETAPSARAIESETEIKEEILPDFYQKVQLAIDGMPSDEPYEKTEDGEEPPVESGPAVPEGGEEGQFSLEDLEGNLLFTLEDPLDVEQEPSVTEKSNRRIKNT